MNVDLGSVIAGLSLLVGTVFTGLVSMRNSKTNVHGADAVRLRQYDRWAPPMLRLVADLRMRMAAANPPIAEPDGIDETLMFPPKDEKVTPDA